MAFLHDGQEMLETLDEIEIHDARYSFRIEGPGQSDLTHVAAGRSRAACARVMGERRR
jgi:hypothetical protein